MRRRRRHNDNRLKYSESKPLCECANDIKHPVYRCSIDLFSQKRYRSIAPIRQCSLLATPATVTDSVRKHRSGCGDTGNAWIGYTRSGMNVKRRFNCEITHYTQIIKRIASRVWSRSLVDIRFGSELNKIDKNRIKWKCLEYVILDNQVLRFDVRIPATGLSHKQIQIFNLRGLMTHPTHDWIENYRQRTLWQRITSCTFVKYKVKTTSEFRKYVQNELFQFLFVVDSSHTDSLVYIVCDYWCAAVDHLHGQRWFHEERSIDSHRRPICGLLVSDLPVAHHATRETFHQTNTAETNHTHFVDGANLCD